MLVDGKWMENWQPVLKADEQGASRARFRVFATGSPRMAAPDRRGRTVSKPSPVDIVYTSRSFAHGPAGR